MTTIFIQLLSDANGIGCENEGGRKRRKQFMAQFCTFLLVSSLCMRFLPLAVRLQPLLLIFPHLPFRRKRSLKAWRGGGWEREKKGGFVVALGEKDART